LGGWKLLKPIEEAGKYVEITGFRNVDIKDAEEFVKVARKGTPKSCWVQFFDAELVATWQHLYFAVLNALLAFRSGRNVSKSVAMEAMLYASAQRQISKALQFIGVKRDAKNVAVVVLGESPASVEAILSAVAKRVGVEPDESVLAISEEKAQRIREAFGITVTELETVMGKGDGVQALVDLVVERVALLSTRL
jgi:tRNA threonylcarbamoyladenosine modification (KEOPS) complex Cgi121 subunit